MKIGIYADIEYGVCGGVQQYIEKLVNALLANTTEEIVVITNKKFYDKFFLQLELSYKFLCVIIEKNECIIKEAIKKLNLDVLHFPIQTFPEYYLDVPTVITLHDLQHEYFPDFFDDRELNYRKIYYKQSADVCDQILVSFKHVKDDIVKFLKISEEKITVASLGLENREKMFLDYSIDICKKFGINEKFILYPAQTWKHKNHIRLFNAIKMILTKYNKDIQLVCTGKKNNYYEQLNQYIMENNLENNIKFLGFVSDEELSQLYIKSMLVVIPTLYEAGSFPLFEAMTLNVPVICSNVTSLPETIGDNRFIFDPYSVEDIAEKIMQMIENKDLCNENITNSINQMEKYCWQDKIKNFICAYKIAINHFNEYKRYKKIYKNRLILENENEIELKKINKKIEDISDNETIIIYAAGEHTRHLINDTNISEKNVLCIVDKNPRKKHIFGYEIKGLEFINKLKPNVILISSFAYQDEIEGYLINNLNYSGRIIKLYEDNKKPFFN